MIGKNFEFTPTLNFSNQPKTEVNDKLKFSLQLARDVLIPKNVQNMTFKYLPAFIILGTFCNFHKSSTDINCKRSVSTK